MKKWMISSLVAACLMASPVVAMAQEGGIFAAVNGKVVAGEATAENQVQIKTIPVKGTANATQTVRVYDTTGVTDIPITGQVKSINGQVIGLEDIPVLVTGKAGAFVPLYGEDSEEQRRENLSTHTIPVYTRSYLEKNALTPVKNEGTGKGVKVAVIDTGISLSHSDLKVVDGMDTLNYTNFGDENGHGTAVSAIIASKEMGIAPDVELYSVKVMGASNKGNGDDMAEGINWAIDHHMDIINMSISLDASYYPVDAAVARAIQAGIVFVVSAGNTGGAVGNPASLPGVISVGALSTNLKSRASFSSYVGKIDFMAPGEGVKSATLQGGYVFGWNGTSLAAPYVAGIFALYKEAYPTLTADQLKSKVIEESTTLEVGTESPSGGWHIPQRPKLQERNVYLPVKNDFGNIIGVKRFIQKLLPAA